jgi:phosphohistidine phosphatase
MILYIVRHAIAEQRQENHSEADDSQRPLTDQGRKKFRKIARGLLGMGMEVETILTSPYLRAADTAGVLQKELGLKKSQLIEVDELKPGADGGQLMSRIGHNYASLQSIAFVGHEPDLSRLISMLISGDPSLAITLKKGGICCLSAQDLRYGRCATLEWLMAPAQLADINR